MNQEYIVPCPQCGTTERTQYVTHLPNTPDVDVMCWDNCGMDFRVNYLWFMLNRINQGEEE